MLNQEQYNRELFVLGWGKSLSSSVKEYVLSSNETHTVREFIEKALNTAGIRFHNDNPNCIEPVIDKNALEFSYQYNYSTWAAKIPLVVVSREFYRPAEVQLLHGDSTAARKELGWKPSISFDELVNRMIANDINLLTQETKGL